MLVDGDGRTTFGGAIMHTGVGDDRRLPNQHIKEQGQQFSSAILHSSYNVMFDGNSWGNHRTKYAMLADATRFLMRATALFQR